MVPPPPFSWTSGALHAEVIVAVAALGVAYGWAQLRNGRRFPAREPACFFGGLVAVLAVLNGPLHDLSDHYLFSAHMVQHLVLTLLVPPLLLAGTPTWMADAVLRPLVARRATAAVATGVTRPLPALALFTAAVVGWHLPGPYNAALEIHGWHVVEHVVLLLTAVLAWWPVLSPSTRLPSLPYAAQILYLFVFGMPMTVVAAMVTGAEDVLYPFYAAAPRVMDISPLADQRLGGVIMWVPAGIVPLVVFTLVFFRWAAAEADEPA